MIKKFVWKHAGQLFYTTYTAPGPEHALGNITLTFGSGEKEWEQLQVFPQNAVVEITISYEVEE